jgi:uncharacterized protein YbbC (DUF1343 family)
MLATRHRRGHHGRVRLGAVLARARQRGQAAPRFSFFTGSMGKPVLGLALAVVGGLCSMPAMANVSPRPVVVGAEVLHANGFAALAGKRVGLIANQTSLASGSHLADLLKAAPGVRLAALFAPEHGLRGGVEAGASVGHAVDEKTGVRVWSLYGRSRKPTPAMLRDIDVLMFDVQDIGARFYTYISTLGLAMQAAAAANIPFMVLDRPNPLGGDYVTGFVLEGSLRSFVGQYPIPIVHGLTVGEIARMIKGEGWLDGLERLDLEVVKMENWQRGMRWPETQLTWVPTSPNIPSFQSALLYPGIGLVGETTVNEGRGTATPFAIFGAPWLKAPSLIARLERAPLAGVRFEALTYGPVSIPGVAQHPRFVGQSISGVRLIVTDAARVEPLEIGVHVLAAISAQARAAGVRRLVANVGMFHALAGTKRLYRMLLDGADASAIVAAWRDEVEAFKALRVKYLLY